MQTNKSLIVFGAGIFLGLSCMAAHAAPQAKARAGEAQKEQRAQYKAQRSPASIAGNMAGSIIAPLPYSTNGDSTGNPNLFVDDGCTEYDRTWGPEAIYTVTPGTAANLQFTVTSGNGEYDPAIYLLEVENDIDSCLVGSDDVPSAFAPSISYSNFTPNQTYYFYVDSYYDSDFDEVPPGTDYGPFGLVVSGTFPVQLTDFAID